MATIGPAMKHTFKKSPRVLMGSARPTEGIGSDGLTQYFHLIKITCSRMDQIVRSFYPPSSFISIFYFFMYFVSPLINVRSWCLFFIYSPEIHTLSLMDLYTLI